MRGCGTGTGYARCSNGVRFGVCTWVLPETAAGGLCQSCLLTRTIPDVADARNVALWGRMESAKRRLIVSLFQLGIPLVPKLQDPESGIAFDMLSSRVDPSVKMGHLGGVITLVLEEADDSVRAANRQKFGEASRTLLGHVRHESGHYIWERWLGRTPPDGRDCLAFRSRFGDESADYGAALRRYYQQGPAPGWVGRFLTPYASSHPWEDWAETWNHYVQISDGLETVKAMGLHATGSAFQVAPLPEEAARLPEMLPQSRRRDAAFLKWVNQWAGVSTVLNEIALSVGEPPLSPHVLSVSVVQKLRLIHWLVTESRVLDAPGDQGVPGGGMRRWFQKPKRA